MVSSNTLRGISDMDITQSIDVIIDFIEEVLHWHSSNTNWSHRYVYKIEFMQMVVIV